MHIKIIATLVAFSLAEITTAAPPPPLAPTGPWQINFANSMCVLSRPYGKNREVSLLLKPSMVGEDLQIIMSNSTTSQREVKDGIISLTVPGGAPIQLSYTAYSTEKTRLVRINGEDGKISLASLRGSLSLDSKAEGRYNFALPGLERALPILSDCVNQLRTAYKVSDADLAAIATWPVGTMAGLFKHSDYPGVSVLEDQFGTVGVLIWVAPTGQVESCEVIESNATGPLEQVTCKVLKQRALFRPARDATGKAVRAPIFQRVRWALQD